MSKKVAKKTRKQQRNEPDPYSERSKKETVAAFDDKVDAVTHTNGPFLTGTFESCYLLCSGYLRNLMVINISPRDIVSILAKMIINDTTTIEFKATVEEQKKAFWKNSQQASSRSSYPLQNAMVLFTPDITQLPWSNPSARKKSKQKAKNTYRGKSNKKDSNSKSNSNKSQKKKKKNSSYNSKSKKNSNMYDDDGISIRTVSGKKEVHFIFQLANNDCKDGYYDSGGYFVECGLIGVPKQSDDSQSMFAPYFKEINDHSLAFSTISDAVKISDLQSKLRDLQQSKTRTYNDIYERNYGYNGYNYHYIDYYDPYDYDYNYDYNYVHVYNYYTSRSGYHSSINESRNRKVESCYLSLARFDNGNKYNTAIGFSNDDEAIVLHDSKEYNKNLCLKIGDWIDMCIEKDNGKYNVYFCKNSSRNKIFGLSNSNHTVAAGGNISNNTTSNGNSNSNSKTKNKKVSKKKKSSRYAKKFKDHMFRNGRFELDTAIYDYYVAIGSSKCFCKNADGFQFRVTVS